MYCDGVHEIAAVPSKMLSSSKLLDELLYTATGGKGRGKLRVGDIVCPFCAVIMYI